MRSDSVEGRAVHSVEQQKESALDTRRAFLIGTAVVLFALFIALPFDDARAADPANIVGNASCGVFDISVAAVLTPTGGRGSYQNAHEGQVDRGLVIDVAPPGTGHPYWCVGIQLRHAPPEQTPEFLLIQDIGDGETSFDGVQIVQSASATTCVSLFPDVPYTLPGFFQTCDSGDFTAH